MAAFYPIFLNLESRRCLVVGGGMEAERYGRGEIRLTSGQNLIIPYVPDPFLDDLTAEPLFQGLRYDPSPIMRGLVSCTGIEFCNLAVIETKHRALTIARALAHTVTPTKSVTIAWSGCPAGSGNHHVADVGLQGSKAKVDGQVVDAVTIFVGGKSGKGHAWPRRSWRMSPATGSPLSSTSSSATMRANPRRKDSPSQ